MSPDGQTVGYLTIGRQPGLRVDYDVGPRHRVVKILDGVVELDSSNVIVVDNADGSGGRATVRATGCVAIQPTKTLLQRVTELPGIKSTIGPIRRP